ncbi:hypothetical protein [Crocosphaera sp.]|uniref:hypothetical protein n=1 Tax=Crocosphaera sp. TaxID=2729996 RepID=UPI003F269728|nr:hypothetical protein [Crocosphaera sp.]
MNNKIFLERISDQIYGEAVNLLSNEYYFLNGSENGGKMRLANYFVGISQSFSDEFIAFINHVVAQTKNNNFPEITLPEGFASQDENLTDFEKNNKFSFASFDMAITEDGLQSIEFQAIVTYPFTATKLNQFIKNKLDLSNTYIFANNKKETWTNFISIYQTIMGGKYKKPIVLIDRNVQNQKTNFEFYAMQKELGIPVDIVDVEDVFEQDAMLFYQTANKEKTKIERLYNRVLPSEAIYEDHYPTNLKWGFRYDKLYQDLKFINHPRKLFEVSKRLLPYLDHPFNPPAFELKNVVSEFLNGSLSYHDYVWKHKEGAAGFSLILSPTETILKQLIEENRLFDYVVQRKVNYKIFKTDDGLEKIVELRFMTAYTKESTNIIPMARIGHCVKHEDGSMVYKIHFGDNNRSGYGLAPVLIFSD